MDFVVVGFGLGALGILLGVVMLGWLAPRSQRAAARASSADDAARDRAVAAEHHGTGRTFLYAGGAMLLATVAGLLGSLDDRTGAFLVATTATVAAIGILLGGYLQRARNPVPLRRRTRSAPEASAPLVTAPPPVDLPWFLADAPPQGHDPVAAESDVERLHAEILLTTDSGAEGLVAEEMAPLPSTASAALLSDTDPDPLDDSPIAAETTDSGSSQPAAWSAGNGSGDRDLTETEVKKSVARVAPVAHGTESSPSRPDEEDPSS